LRSNAEIAAIARVPRSEDEEEEIELVEGIILPIDDVTTGNEESGTEIENAEE
jgi:hypothetical protein